MALVLNPSVMGAVGPRSDVLQPSNPGLMNPQDIHILLVDDERLSRLVVGNLLRTCKYKVTIAESGSQALEVLQRAGPGAFQLILTDVMMPEVDGLEILRFVRNHQAFTNLPVVMMSASERQETMCACIRGGAEEYLVKPVTRKEVQNIWTHVMKRLNSHTTIKVEGEVGLGPVQAFGGPSQALDGALQQSLAASLAHLSAGPATIQPPLSLPSSSMLPDYQQLQLAPSQPPHASGVKQAAGQRPAAAGTANRKLDKVNLLKWLLRPNRSVVPKESFWIFCEVLLLLEQAHGQSSQSVQQLRPGCMVLYSNGKVAFVADPTDASGSGKRSRDEARRSRSATPPRILSTNANAGSDSDSAGTVPGAGPTVGANQLSLGLMAPAGLHASTESSCKSKPVQQVQFSAPSTAAPAQAAAPATDEQLYCSPEEAAGQPATSRSDVFNLGLLFFELFFVPAEGTRVQVLSELRQRTPPPRFLKHQPKEAAFTMALLHPDPSARPSVAELLASDMFRDTCNSLRQRHASLAAAEAALQSQVLADFLGIMQQRKLHAMQRVRADMAALSADITCVEHVLHKHIQRGTAKRPRLSTSGHSGAAASQLPSPTTAGPSSSSAYPNVPHSPSASASTAGGSPSGSAAMVVHNNLGDEQMRAAETRWLRITPVYPQLEGVYFQRRTSALPQLTQGLDHPHAPVVPLLAAPEPGSAGATQPLLQHQLQPAAVGDASASGLMELPAHLASFSRDLTKYTKYHGLQVVASLRYGDALTTSNMVCSAAFDRDDEFFATAGVSKRIKIFEYHGVANSSVGLHYPVLEINSRSRLSSVCWSSYIKSHLASADYEGVVQLWDANTNSELAQFEEHAKRAWSVDFSQVDPARLVSGSDDGTIKLWSINQEHSCATIDIRANVCSVQFSPESSHMVAAGSANYRVYLYDLRNPSTALAVIPGHNKAVSYVRYISGNELVSASTDSTLKLWDLSSLTSGPTIPGGGGAAAGAPTMPACAQTFTGHTNERNFVGLSVSNEGYIACGSENNTVYTYYRTMPMPVTCHQFGAAEATAGVHGGVDDTAAGGESGHFVSSVCWSRRSNVLLAANSVGTIKILSMV